MPSTLNLQPVSLAQATELFKVEFHQRYPQSRFLLDGEGYEDEDLDLNVYVDGDQLELERYAVEVSLTIQRATGYFILPFILPTAAHPTGI
ncbi:MAG: hypothetical protein HYZ50_11825 [Deltaproteobacteria bacterium]|nr:hypothetical protein [Deltaproteobacteria bacterium]